MPRKIRVFGGCFDGKNRLIVAATSMKQAAEHFKIPYHTAKEYGSETWNDLEVATAMAKVGTVFFTASQWMDRGYKERTQVIPCR